MKMIVNKIFGSANERELKRIWPLVEKINGLEPEFEKLSDIQLREQTDKFRRRLEEGETLDDLLPEAFAVVREAGKRTLGMRHFDVQLVGGIVLHNGRIAEMKTGEGKTLCATLPVYLNALPGKGVHVVTVNDYLARRDAEWMSAIYAFLGLTTGVVVQGMEPHEVYEGYRADITYGQNNQYGFDYLRDNLKMDASEMVQRGHFFAIVDEVDSILVDEARTPLIISGPSDKPTELYRTANDLVKHLTPKESEDEDAPGDYSVELKSKQVSLSDQGVKRVEQLLGIDNLYDPQHIDLVHHIQQALKANVTMKRDVDYLVRNGEVMIVDEFTGRVMHGRRWSDGLHQAVEAKEGVEVQRESQTYASITFQNYFRMYDKLAGMTGTADTEAVEFKKIYGLDVVVIPTNEPMVRQDNPDVVFVTERAKYEAVCEEISDLHKTGQPVLVGTASIAKSELVSMLLTKKKIPHHVLNAKHNEQEAYIVAQAGRLGAVTISTNMAGRGTDIILGGNPVFLAEEEVGTRDPENPEFQEALKRYEAICAEEKKKVLEAGGLFVLGTERHESRRIDNQLRGRSGRQGDPGGSRFYVSLEDDLMKRFGGERMQAIMARVGVQEDEAIEGTLVARAIENAQKKVEGYHFDIRKHLLEYDDVMNKQREVIYNLRSKVLRSEDIDQTLQEIIPELIEELILVRANDKEPPHAWDLKGMFTEFFRLFGLKLDDEADILARQESANKEIAQEIFELMERKAAQELENRKKIIGEQRLLDGVRWLMLKAINQYWMEHLAAMDHLKEGIGLRGYGQRNPLHEYQREAFYLFSAMLSSINHYVVSQIFLSRPLSEDEVREIEEKLREEQRQQEKAAEMTHEDVVEGGNKEEGKGDAGGPNRRQRRRQAARTKEDYLPTDPGTGQSSSKSKSRKKNKAARRARKGRR
ncbi:MAG: preprotein translocase subunit SecA [Bdellovibrionales bacterium]|nr:preprotein translocase subunit SecA [Bdellovibrionales bacterium]